MGSAEPPDELLRLLARRHERDRRGLAAVEGVAPFLNACAAGFHLEAVIWSRILLRSSVAQKLVRLRKREGVPTRQVDPRTFRRLSHGGRASGVAAIVRQRWRTLERADPRGGSCWVVLERIRSPGNLGTILRTAEAAGAAGLILLGPELDPYERAVIRASMGAIFHLPLVRCSPASFAAWSARHGVQVIAASPQGAWRYDELPLRPARALLLGEEREGLTPEAFELAEARVQIPILGQGDSLNVAVAGGVLLYELLRRGS